MYFQPLHIRGTVTGGYGNASIGSVPRGAAGPAMPDPDRALEYREDIVIANDGVGSVRRAGECAR